MSISPLTTKSPLAARTTAAMGTALAALTFVAGEVVPVSPGESIAAVLARASAGDVIELAAGEYHERLVIEVPVTLRGEPGARIRGGYEGNVVHVKAPGCVLEGLTVMESGTELTKDYACILIEADDVVVEDCEVERPLHGIYVKGGQRAVLRRNRIVGRSDLVEEDRGNGIHLWNSTGNVIVGNEILGVRDGIYFSFAHETRVWDNHVHQVRYGLHYMYSNDNTFENNLFERNVAGAALMYSEDIRFTGNVFARCRGFRAYGILFQSMKRVSAEDNLVLDNSRGIFMNNSSFGRIVGNDIVDSDLAIQLNGGCDENLFTKNNFIGNLSQLLLDTSDRSTRWSESGRGNYWSSYRGYDLNRDGIGDLPYEIQNVFQQLEGRHPEVRFYVLSPAARILEVAERALPILAQRDAVDSHPLQRPEANANAAWARVEQRVGAPSPVGATLLVLLLAGLFGGLVRATRVAPERAATRKGAVE